jgi:hypothetical protein
MSEMNDYTKSVLRSQILHHRVELRKARAVVKGKRVELNHAMHTGATDC